MHVMGAETRRSVAGLAGAVLAAVLVAGCGSSGGHALDVTMQSTPHDSAASSVITTTTTMVARTAPTTAAVTRPATLPPSTAAPTPPPTTDAPPVASEDAAASGTGEWAVLLGSLGTREKAEQRLAYLASTAPDAQLLHSDDYASLTPGYWVVYEGGYATAEDALAACAGMGFTDRHDCYASYLSHDPDDRHVRAYPD